MFIPLIMTPSYHFSPFHTLQTHFSSPFRFSIPNPFFTPMPDHDQPLQSYQYHQSPFTIFFSSHFTNSNTLPIVLFPTKCHYCAPVKSIIFNLQPQKFPNPYNTSHPYTTSVSPTFPKISCPYLSYLPNYNPFFTISTEQPPQ